MCVEQERLKYAGLQGAWMGACWPRRAHFRSVHALVVLLVHEHGVGCSNCRASAESYATRCKESTGLYPPSTWCNLALILQAQGRRACCPRHDNAVVFHAPYLES